MGGYVVAAFEFVCGQRRHDVWRRSKSPERAIYFDRESYRHVSCSRIWSGRGGRKRARGGLHACEDHQQRNDGNADDQTERFEASLRLCQNLTVKFTFSRVCEYVSDGIRLS